MKNAVYTCLLSLISISSISQSPIRVETTSLSINKYTRQSHSLRISDFSNSVVQNGGQINYQGNLTLTPEKENETLDKTEAQEQTLKANSPASLSKIPVNPKYWYQLNNLGDATKKSTGLKQLTDGIIDQEVFMGWSKLLPNYDCFYEFKELKDVMISKIRFYDGEGSFADKPFKVYARPSLTKPPVLIATFTGEKYAEWVEVNLPSPIKAQYLIINCWWGFPTEMEFYGSYNQGSLPLLGKRKDVKLKDMFGINAYVWDFLQNSEDPNLRDRIYEPKMKLMQAFTQYRDYIDWGKVEPKEGVYTFNHTLDGGWNYDLMYKRFKQEGKDVLACFKTLPNWFLEKYYPKDERDAENIPAPFGSDLLKPQSYILQAKAGFQFAARYGSTKVDKSLLSGVLTGTVWPGDPNSPVMTVETGLGYIRYIECDNERDKWWKGRKAYQTGYEYAANLSAFYDGHKNTMGAGVGVKNADPNMKVVIGGIASTQTDYIRAIIDWCKEFRGFKPNGEVDLCFDVINYHMYNNDAMTSQGGYASRGAAPEVSGNDEAADEFVELARTYNLEVWITETGYDINQHSPIKAIPIGNKSVLDVQADWILRTALANARHGISKTFFYQSYDEHIESWLQFSSSGLLDGTARKRKPAADYLLQTNKLLGEYIYKETLEKSPLVDRYELEGISSAYVLAMPTETGQSVAYTLDLNGADSAKIYVPKAGADSMDVQKVKLENGKLKLTVTETPVFVIPMKKKNDVAGGGGSDDKSDESTSTSGARKLLAEVKLYPNPANQYIDLLFKNKSTKDFTINLYNMIGNLCQTHPIKQQTSYSGKINLSALRDGSYIVEVVQGNERAALPFIKQSHN